MKYLAIITLVFILAGCNNQPENISKENVTTFSHKYNFEYTNPNEDIPKKFEMTNWDYTKNEADNFACKSGDQIKEYPLFNNPLTPCPNSNYDGCGGTFERTAYKCDNENEYIIKEFHPAVGPIFYGPFSLTVNKS